MRGTAPHEILEFKALAREVYVYAGNLAVNTSKADIMQHLQSKLPRR